MTSACSAAPATRWLPEKVQAFAEGLESGKVHPRDAKMELAQEITAIFHGEEGGEQGKQAFINVFQQGEVPDEMDEFALKPGMSVLDVLSDSGLVKSRGEGRRMIEQNGVRLDGETLNDPNAEFPHPGVLQVGKRRFLQVK